MVSNFLIHSLFPFAMYQMVTVSAFKGSTTINIPTPLCHFKQTFYIGLMLLTALSLLDRCFLKNDVSKEEKWLASFVAVKYITEVNF